jgi:hypothetical protein
MNTILGIVLIFVPILTPGDIIPIPGSQRIKPIFDSSDLVCSGTVISVDISTDSVASQGTPGWINQRARATIQVEDVYKQVTPSQSRVLLGTTAKVPEASARFSIFRRGDKFLFFLKLFPDGDYGLADPFLGATHFQALPERSEGMGLLRLQNSLAATLLGQSEEDVATSLRLLSGFDTMTDQNLGVVSRFRSSPNPSIALAAINVLLIAKNPQSLIELVQYLKEYKGNSEPFAFSNIGNRLADFRDQESLTLIKELTRSRFLPIREGAMRSLRGRRSPASVPELVDRLQDTDSTIQYLAVITLAEVVGKYDGDYAPSMYLFDKNPQYYTNLWRQWWADQGRSLYAKPYNPK